MRKLWGPFCYHKIDQANWEHSSWVYVLRWTNVQGEKMSYCTDSDTLVGPQWANSMLVAASRIENKKGGIVAAGSIFSYGAILP